MSSKMPTPTGHDLKGPKSPGENYCSTQTQEVAFAVLTISECGKGGYSTAGSNKQFFR